MFLETGTFRTCFIRVAECRGRWACLALLFQVDSVGQINKLLLAFSSPLLTLTSLAPSSAYHVGLVSFFTTFKA